MTKESQKHGSGSRTRTDLSHTPNAQLGNPEKREIKDKPHRWIEARVRCLDPAGYMEEINSLRYFGRNAGCFALQIVAVADWGRKYLDMGFRYPIPVFPSSSSLPYRTHTRADPRSPSSRPRCTHPEETCAKEAEKPGSGWWQSYNFGEMRCPPPTA